MEQYTYYIFLVGMVVVLYFLMIRPDSKKRKAIAQMRKEIAPGDEVVTIGGIVGKVINVDGDTLVIETGEDRVRIEIKNWGVSTKNGFDPNARPVPKKEKEGK